MISPYGQVPHAACQRDKSRVVSVACLNILTPLRYSRLRVIRQMCSDMVITPFQPNNVVATVVDKARTPRHHCRGPSAGRSLDHPVAPAQRHRLFDDYTTKVVGLHDSLIAAEFGECRRRQVTKSFSRMSLLPEKPKSRLRVSNKISGFQRPSKLSCH